MEKQQDNSGKRTIQKTHSKIGKAIKEYDLIHEGDRIMIGVSGGKDSMTLLSVLATRRRFSNIKYDIVAVHIDVENVPYSIDQEYIAGFCKEYDIDFVVEKITVDFEKDPGKSHCFVCSWHRRKRLFELTKIYNCNKLALGHHLDDAIETLIINMCYHGSISSMPATLKMFNGRIDLIRPLILLTNQEIRKFAVTMGFPSEKEVCPYEDKTKRTQAGEIIREMEKRFKPARKSIFKSMQKIFVEYLPVEHGKDPVIPFEYTKNKEESK
ncbi:MAG: tRNA 2-thiocytidine(32) synthetase TtcA [Bacteroidales bacterium]|jgi:tRNA(Ile)-lysidine synthetase-like protein|nr:tRNA 2-thiocytidine(32) synthetase TtcA [Bacteroidales bacterium]